MGQLANDIHNEATARIPAAPVADPADLMTGPQLLQVFAKVEAAIAVLELVTRGARIVRVAGVPNDVTDGEDGDLGLNTLTADYYGKDNGAWTFLYNGKGPRGTNATGVAGLSAYQLALQQGFVGSLDQWLASLGRKGDDGRSAYQVATANGFVGTVTQWLASLKGAPGDPGARGGLIYSESFAPTAAYAGQPGDVFYWHISQSEYAIYDYPSALLAAGANPWRQRFATPDAVSGGGTGGTANYPAQSPATANQYLQSTGVAGAERWAAVVAGKVAWDYAVGNITALPPIDFRRDTQITLAAKTVGIASASYSVSGAQPTPFVFTSAGIDTRGITILAGGSLTISSITYTAGYNAGTLFFEGTQS